MQTIKEKASEMGRVVTGVTIETFPLAVRRAGLKPGQRFSLVVETDEEIRTRAFDEVAAIAERVSARVAADGLNEDDVMRRLEEEDGIR